MTNFVIGSQAEIIDEGKLYTTYTGFARKNGYPDAAAESDCEDTRRKLVNGDVVTLLASGKHEWSSYNHPIWVVETTHNERYLISEEGLRSLDNIAVLKDESLGGVEREYREVKRKAAVGERIKFTGFDRGSIMKGVVNPPDEGAVLRVVGRYDNRPIPEDAVGVHVTGHPNIRDNEYVTLEPSDIVRINSARFRMVDRKAAVGERVIVTDVIDNYGFFSRGNIGVFGEGDWVDFNGQGNIGYDECDGIWRFGHNNGCSKYRVLEPVESAEVAPTPEPLSAKPAPDQAAEIIVALTTRVTALEKRVAALEFPPVNPRFSDVGVTVQVATDAFAKAVQSIQERTSVTVAEVTANLAKRAKEARQRKRDDIVKRAKEDLAKFKKTHHPTLRQFYERDYIELNAEFIVDREKRTVVCLLRERNVKAGVRYRGIAKCTPGDVFNSHIGRAIALRRALGLEIPEEYISAPQPTEVRVGDIVKSTRDDEVYTVVPEVEWAAGVLSIGYVRGSFGGKLVLVDDSRESDSAEPRKEVA